jgi:NADH-quinone oxidoreductase subunit L
MLAAFAVLLGFMGAPFWPWFQSFLEGEQATVSFAPFLAALPLMIVSTCLVFLGLGLGWMLYGRKSIEDAKAPDALQEIQPRIFSVLGHAFYIDNLYEATFLRANAWWAVACDWLDRWVWNGAVQVVSYFVLSLAWVDNFFDTYVVNGGFDAGCETVSRGSWVLSLLQGGRVQNYLRMIGVALIVFVILMLWGARA